ncbi:MAG: glycosyltransferase [Chthoniobacterales bacterium]
MNIAFFASSLLSAYWNGAATYYRGIIKALHAHGHKVTFYEPVAYDRPQHRDIEPPDWARVIVYEGTESEARRHVQMARDADLIVKASGVGIFDELLEAAVLELKRSNNLVIFWDVDAPATLERIENDPNDPFRQLIPQYDFVLTYGGGDPVVRGYTSYGAKMCVPIYNALDPDTHHPVPPDPRFRCDLGLLANRLPDREQRVEEFFLRAAQALPLRSFILGGNGWETKSLPSNVRYLGHVYTRDHNPFNCTARSVLNICRASMARYGFSPPTRVFEAAGAAACLITDAWEGVEQFFEPGRELLVAHTGDEVAAHVDGLSAGKAQEIGAAAYRRVLAEHTYAHRALQVEQILSGTSRGKSMRPSAFARRDPNADADIAAAVVASEV